MKPKYLLQVRFLLLIHLFSSLVHSTNPGNFWATGYDSCAVSSCLNPITTASNCELADNNCVCTTSSFVSQVAKCLGQYCSSVVASIYTALRTNCAAYGGYTLALSGTQFIAAAGVLETYLESTFWNAYPTCANAPCLSPLTAASGCEIDDNACVCTNGTLLGQMAQCIGQKCDTTTVSNIYAQYASVCSGHGGYAVALSSGEWASIAASNSGGNVGTPPSQDVSSTAGIIHTTGVTSSYIVGGTDVGTSAPSSTSTATTSPSSISADTSTSASAGSKGGGGYTEDQKIALGTGIGIPLAALLVAIIAICVNRRRR